MDKDELKTLVEDDERAKVVAEVISMIMTAALSGTEPDWSKLKALVSKLAPELPEIDTVELGRHHTFVDAVRNEFNDAVCEYNERMARYASDVLRAREKYEEARSSAEDFVSATAGVLRDFYDAQTDVWQESTPGDKFQKVVRAWERFEIEEAPDVSNIESEIEDIGSEQQIEDLPEP